MEVDLAYILSSSRYSPVGAPTSSNLRFIIMLSNKVINTDLKGPLTPTSLIDTLLLACCWSY